MVSTVGRFVGGSWVRDRPDDPGLPAKNPIAQHVLLLEGGCLSRHGELPLGKPGTKIQSKALTAVKTARGQDDSAPMYAVDAALE